MTTARRHALLVTALSTLCGLIQARETLQPLPYEIRGERIFIPGWDDRSVTNGRELLRLKPEDFAPGATIYRNRVLLTSQTARSREFVLPDISTEIELLGRSTPESGVFPKIRVSLLPVAGGNPRVLHEGFAQSASLAPITMKIPQDLAGQSVKLQLEILNPSQQNDIRVYYLAHVSVR